MDKLKQKQKQSVSVVVNVAHPKLRRKTKRRVRAKKPAPPSSLTSSYEQPLTRMIRYDVYVPQPSQPSDLLKSGVARAPQVSAGNLIVDTPLEVLNTTPATTDNLAGNKVPGLPIRSGKKRGPRPGTTGKLPPYAGTAYAVSDVTAVPADYNSDAPFGSSRAMQYDVYSGNENDIGKEQRLMKLSAMRELMRGNAP